MNKIFTLAFFLTILAYQEIGAQTEKSTWLLGGAAYFESRDNENLININPNIGYFFINNFAGGLNAGFASFSGSSYYQLGPFARYYIGNSERGKFFTQASFSYNKITGDFNSQSASGYGLKAGYAAFLNTSIALELAAGYNKIEDNTGSFGINIGFQIHFKKSPKKLKNSLSQ